MRGEVRLGDWLTRIEAGKSPMAEDTSAGAGEWGVLKVSAIQPGGLVVRENKVIRDLSLVDPRYEVRDGDLLLTRANTEEFVGQACVVEAAPAKLLLSDKTLRLHVDESHADRKFVQLVLCLPEIRCRVRALATGTSAGMKNIGQEQIRQLPVPDVPLAEQHRIVAAHASFERRIGALERTLVKLRKAETAVVASALDAQRRVPLGTWLSRIEAGKSPLAEDTPARDGEWGVLKVSAVQAGWFEAAENKVLRDPEHIDPRYEVRPGDLLMTRANTEALVGLACVVREPGPKLLLSDKTLRLVPEVGSAEVEFLALTLASPAVRVQIKAAATGTSASMKNIGQEAIRALLVPDVSLAVQRQAVVGVSGIQRRVSVYRRQIAKLRTIQHGVVEDLLAGRVRLAAA